MGYRTATRFFLLLLSHNSSPYLFLSSIYFNPQLLLSKSDLLKLNIKMWHVILITHNSTYGAVITFHTLLSQTFAHILLLCPKISKYSLCENKRPLSSDTYISLN